MDRTVKALAKRWGISLDEIENHYNFNKKIVGVLEDAFWEDDNNSERLINAAIRIIHCEDLTSDKEFVKKNMLNILVAMLYSLEFRSEVYNLYGLIRCEIEKEHITLEKYLAENIEKDENSYDASEKDESAGQNEVPDVAEPKQFLHGPFVVILISSRNISGKSTAAVRDTTPVEYMSDDIESWGTISFRSNEEDGQVFFEVRFQFDEKYAKKYKNGIPCTAVTVHITPKNSGAKKPPVYTLSLGEVKGEKATMASPRISGIDYIDGFSYDIQFVMLRENASGAE
jgi:hypothetical protein